MKSFQPKKILLIFICFILVCTGLYAQEEKQEQEDIQERDEIKTGREYKPREQKLYIDIPMTLGEIVIINVIGNIYWRIWGSDSETAYVTLESMRKNFDPTKWHTWSFEIGRGRDTFLVNQFFHPYAGGLYFSSARSNNMNFYWSIFAPAVGSFTWEALCEIESPSASDFINTTVGGIAIGEMLHRIYTELNKGGLGAKIGASFVSPSGRLTDAVRRYGPADGPNKINRSSLALGFSWINARFFDGSEETSFWNTWAGFLDFDLVYGEPFTSHSVTPFDQFDLNILMTLTIPLIYNFTFIADGYLASWLLNDDAVYQAINGLTLHYDVFVIDKGAILQLNNGRENLDFNANSLDYSVKWRRRELSMFNKTFDFSMKTHIGFSPWAETDYNGGVTRDDNNLYLWGGNFKLFTELRQTSGESGALLHGLKNGQVLAFNLCFYDTWNILHTPGYQVNTIFLFSKLAYSFPLTERLSFYLADCLLFLYCHMLEDVGAEFPDITRWYNSAQVGVKISF